VAAQTSYDVIDTPILEQTQFGPDMQRWLPNVVDSINSNFMMVNNLITVATMDIGGGGAGPINVTVLGLMPSGSVNVNLLSSTNSVTITTVSVGTNQFSVTFSGDPGASAVISYQVYTAQPQ
jgi:hypothetical protein